MTPGGVRAIRHRAIARLRECVLGGASSPGEIIYLQPAAWVRQLPVVEVEVLLTAHEAGMDRPIGSYTLVHGGSLHR